SCASNATRPSGVRVLIETIQPSCCRLKLSSSVRQESNGMLRIVMGGLTPRGRGWETQNVRKLRTSHGDGPTSAFLGRAVQLCCDVCVALTIDSVVMQWICYNWFAAAPSTTSC